jgi:hypothetical protein
LCKGNQTGCRERGKPTMTGNNLHFRIRALALVVAAAVTYCALGVASAQNGTAPSAQKPSLDQQLSLTCHIADGLTLAAVAAVGDLLTARPASLTGDTSFQRTTEILREANISFGNSEGNLVDIRRFNGYAFGDKGGCVGDGCARIGERSEAHGLFASVARSLGFIEEGTLRECM